MKFLADECVDLQIVDRLRHDGHTVLYVAEMEPGISDHDVLDLANHEGAVLLTADKDFGELVFRQDKVARGIVLVRLAGLSPAIKADIIATTIEDHGDWVFEFIYGDYFGQCENPTESFPRSVNTSNYQYPKEQAGTQGWLRDRACCCRFQCSVHHNDSRLAVAAGGAITVAAGKGGISVESIRELWYP